jgi:hypothetical protein
LALQALPCPTCSGERLFPTWRAMTLFGMAPA